MNEPRNLYTPAPLAPHQTGHTPACTCNYTPAHAPQTAVSARPTMQITPGALGTVVAGGTVAALVLGTVLVSMLLAVAITAVSLTVSAVVLRALLNDSRTKS